MPPRSASAAAALVGPGHRFIFLLNVAQRRVQRWASEDGREPMTATQAGVVFLLGQADGVLISDLGRALALNPSSMTGLIDRMATAGRVERRSTNPDGRTVQIFLTPLGRTAREQAKRRIDAINQRLVDGFTQEELNLVARSLGQVGERFTKDQESHD